MSDRGRDEYGWPIPDMVIQPAPGTLIRMDFPDGTHTFIEVREDGTRSSWSMGSFRELIGGYLERDNGTDSDDE